MDNTILAKLSTHADPAGWPNTWELAQVLGTPHEEVVSAAKSLEAKQYLVLTQKTENKFVVNEEGRRYASEGTPEFKILKHLAHTPTNSCERAEVEAILKEEFKIGLSNGVKRLFKLEKTALVGLFPAGQAPPDLEGLLLHKLNNSVYFDGVYEAEADNELIKKLKKRQLLEIKPLTYFQLAKGPHFADKVVTLKADLTAEDLAKETWKDLAAFKGLNLQAKGKQPTTGGLHPLLKMRSEFRQILLEMGFEEMKTNNYVESSFWNFDSLFQPQQHSARDSHDTFFLKTPVTCAFDTKEFGEYVEAVRKIHETGFEGHEGSSGSCGWKYQWSIEESQKNIFRTHTTAVSSRYLKAMADDLKKTGVFKPRKYFSIDRVFRNETLDATHLAEFHQVEGLIVGKRLGLGHLKGFIRDFFNRIGITKIKFKPAYNPYTEPSMEIFVEHPILKRTIEIGNSGVFRPEMLSPMGFPEDVSVIAWGLSLERPAMIHFQCGNIRELVGHKVSVESVKESPVISL